MFKQFIDKVEGADTFMVTSFLMFMVFFVLVGLYLLVMDKAYLRKMEALPLEDEKSGTPSTFATKAS